MKTRLAGFLMITVILISCQKEITNQPTSPIVPPPPTTLTRDSTLLARYCIMGGPNLTDSVIRYDYTYDNSKRLATRIIKSWQGLWSPSIETIYLKYTYLGTDALPVKVTFIEYIDQNLYSLDTMFISYNSSHQLTRDSIVGDSSYHTQVVKYQFPGSSILLNFTPLGQPPLIETIHPTYSNGNLVGEIDTSNVGTQNNFFTYDNHPNPLYKVSLSHPTSDNTYDNEFEQPNNMTEESLSESHAGSPIQPAEHKKYIFTYRNDGYPLTMLTKDLLNPTYTDYKSFFIYQ